LSAPLAYGERAFLFAIPAHVDRRALEAALRARDDVADVILTESLACVVARDDEAPASLSDAHLAALPAAPSAPPRDHEIGVVYDGEDLAAVSAATGLSVDDIVAQHAATEHVVSMMGFMPGFAYLRGIRDALVLPRRASPRPRVPAASLAISAHYTGIYPFASPGGWHLIGRAVDFAPLVGDAPRFALGDRVRFRSLRDAPPPRTAPSTDPPPPAVGLRVGRNPGVALVVDRGRVGWMRAGFPRSGPLVPSAAERANAAAQNPPGTPLLEVYGQLTLEAAGGTFEVSDDAGGGARLGRGESITFSSAGGRARYVAVRGGVRVPLVLGSASTLLVAGIGGFCGRALRRGDVLRVGDAPSSTREVGVARPRALDSPPSLDTLAGPDTEDHLDDLTQLSRAVWRVSRASDRTGARLEPVDPGALAAPSADRRRASIPMVEGAVQRTPAGLVVLGPDHPTTGGYPVVAVLGREALDRLSSLPLGAEVRLRSPLGGRGNIDA
jgi:KipI family sensor histidine kinase inhibitor